MRRREVTAIIEYDGNVSREETFESRLLEQLTFCSLGIFDWSDRRVERGRERERGEIINGPAIN